MLARVRINEVVDEAVEICVMRGVGVRHGNTGRCETCVEFVGYAGCCVCGVDDRRRFDDVAGYCEA